MVKVREIRGPKCLAAYNVYSALLLGVKMLPAYELEGYESFYARIQMLSDEDKEKIIREAVAFVKLEDDDIRDVLTFCTDANGVPFGPENIRNLGLVETFESVVAVAKAVSQFKINLVTDSEKKKSLDSQLT